MQPTLIPYFAVVAPPLDLFKELSFDEVIATGFPAFNTHIAKFEYGVPLSEYRLKFKKKWEEEATQWKQEPFPDALKNALTNLDQMLHAYVVLDNEAKMCQALRKGYQSLGVPDGPRFKWFAYYQMLTAISARGSFVQILTDGNRAWSTHSDERLRICHSIPSKDDMIFGRLTEQRIVGEKEWLAEKETRKGRK